MYEQMETVSKQHLEPIFFNMIESNAESSRHCSSQELCEGCVGGKHMINSVHISTSPHAELCRGSKFFYDVIKTASKWLPPESQLEDKKAKI